MSLSIAKITNATASGVSTISASVTTTGAGRLIVIVGAENNSGTAVVFSGVSGGGLTWSRRSTKSNTSVHGQTMEVWYADAASALSAVTITATATANWDDAAMSIELATTTAGVISWDTNASLPKLLSDANGSAVLVTDSADYLALVANGDPATTQLPTGSTPSWLASLDFVSNGAGVNSQGLAVAAGSPTGALVGFTSTVDTSTVTAIDALAAVGTLDLTTPHLHIAKITNAIHSGGTTITATVTTTSAGRLVVVVGAENNSGTAVVFSGVSGGGLTWTRRSTVPFASAHGQTMEVWYADAASALSAVTITATTTASYDDAAMSVELVTADAGYTIAWDTNAGLPKLITGTPGTSAITTDSRNTLVIAASSKPTSGGFPTSPVPSWMTQLDNVTNTGGALFQVLSVAGGSPNVAVGWTGNVKVGSVTAIDAIVAGARTTSGTATAALGALTATATGTRTGRGTASVSLGGVTAAATGTRTGWGTAAAALGGLTATAVSIPLVHGTASAALGGVTANATASAPQKNGTAAATLGGLTAAAVGVRTVHGTASATLGALVASAAGTRSDVATATAALGVLTAAATGVRSRGGVALADLGALIAAAIGTVTGVIVAPVAGPFKWGFQVLAPAKALIPVEAGLDFIEWGFVMLQPGDALIGDPA